jgi:hypothetical protein
MHSIVILPLLLPNDSSIEVLHRPRSRYQQVASKRPSPATNQPMKRRHSQMNKYRNCTADKA